MSDTDAVRSGVGRGAYVEYARQCRRCGRVDHADGGAPLFDHGGRPCPRAGEPLVLTDEHLQRLRNLGKWPPHSWPGPGPAPKWWAGP